MRRLSRFLFIPLVLVAAMAVPASTAATAGYTNVVIDNCCDDASVVLKMTTKAAGYTPANRLTIESWVQRKYPSGWMTIRTWPTRVANFAANGSNHSLTLSRTHTLPDDTFYFHRLKFRLRAWQGTELLAQEVHWLQVPCVRRARLGPINAV